MKLTYLPAFATLFGALGLASCGDSTEPKAPAAPPPVATLKIIATGANIAGANGIHFSPDNQLYVASVVGSNITILDPDSGDIIKRLGGAEGVVGPDDVAFGPDGSFFWTSILTGEVAGFTPSGHRVVAAQLTPGVNPLTFSDDGRLFVSQCFFGTGLFEVDPKGVKPPRMMADDLGPGCGLNGMDWGPDNRLYGPRWFTGEVVSFNVDDNSRTLVASGFQTPASVKFNSRGELHVLDTGTGEVIKVMGDEKTVVATLTPGLDNFAFDKNDRLFVSSFVDGFVKRVEADGSLTTLQPGGMSHPGGITMINGQLAVADLHSIRFFDPATGEQVKVQRAVLGVSEIGGAINLSTDGDSLILVSWVDNDIRVWNLKTNKITERYSGLAAPVAAVRYAGKLIAAEHGGNRIIELSDSGTTEVMAMDSPTALLVVGDDLYSTSWHGGGIMKIGSDNQLLEQPVSVAGGLNQPEGLAWFDGRFIVREGGSGKILAVKPSGESELLTTITPGTSAASAAQPPSMVFNGIAVDDSGAIYATGETDRVLYRFGL